MEFLYVIAFIAVVYFFFMKKAPGSSHVEEISIFKDHNFSPSVYKYFECNDGKDGIAISKDLNNILLAENREGKYVVKIYDKSKLRGHKVSEIDRADKIDDILVYKTRRKFQKMNGLFIDIKDVNFPEWQIPMERKEQNRWHEILSQLYEGTLQS